MPEIFLQILELGLYLESEVSLGVWFLQRTMSPILKFALLGSLMGGWVLSHAIFKFSTAIVLISHIVSRCISHFSSPMYRNFSNSYLNKIGM